MSEEIKLRQSQIEEALNDLTVNTQSLEETLPKEKIGENILNMTEKLNEVNQLFGDVITSYKTILLNNVQTTRQSVETLIQQDDYIASGIKLLD